MSFIHASVHGHVEQEHASHSPHQEFLDYINSPLEIGEHDPVKWWGSMLSDTLKYSQYNLRWKIQPQMEDMTLEAMNLIHSQRA